MRETVAGSSATVVSITRKYLSVVRSAGHSCSSTARESGPCSESAPVFSDTSSIATSMPTAFMWSQRSEESALVNRNVLSPSRLTVPSSITLPAASHHGV